MRRCLIALLLWLAIASRAAALDIQIKDLRTAGPNDAIVRTTLDVRGVVPDRFKHIIETGNVLHLRVQAELWETRPVWDRLVYPAATRIFRIGRGSRGVTIADSAGPTTSRAEVPEPMAVSVDLGDRSRLAAAEKYYLHVVATIGTIADREADEAGDAVFGKEADANGLTSFGRLLFRTAVKVSDYMQSVTTEIKGKKIAGAEILKR
jgi:hypothetical protein